jgi:DNA-binding CsgD family transcriptional regulator
MAKTTKKPATMLEGLQAELATRREKVAACKAKLDEAVERASLELNKAIADVDQYVAKIAETLGLPNPTVLEAKRQETLLLRKQVKGLYKEGKTTVEIAAALGIGVEVVDPIYNKISSSYSKKDEIASSASEPSPADKPLRMPPGAGQKGWKQARVLALYLDGKTKGEIADELDISKESVSTHLSVLRRLGKLPSAGEESGPKSLGGEPAGGFEPDDDLNDGDSLSDLREEVARQQEGQRGKAVRFATAIHDDHDHVAKVDRLGDGQTEPDVTGHQHKIYRFAVGNTAGHDHGLLAKEPVPG